LANKLTSSDSLTSVDYSHLPLCDNRQYGDVVSATDGGWAATIGSLHGDAFRREDGLELRMKENLFCQQLCVLDLDGGNNKKPDGGGDSDNKWKAAIQQGLEYNWYVDGMPSAHRYENQDRVAIRYWGGIPLGQRGETDEQKSDRRGEHDERYKNSSPDEWYIHNHLNIEIMYWKLPGLDDKQREQYRVVRTTMQPYSIKHEFDGSTFPANLYNPIASCAFNVPTYYNELNTTKPQLAEGQVLFTYDVVFTEWESDKDPWKTRWNVFLRYVRILENC